MNTDGKLKPSLELGKFELGLSGIGVLTTISIDRQ